MKRIILINVLFIIFSTSLISQEKRKLKVKRTDRIIEEYYLQKRNGKKGKDGSYIKYKNVPYDIAQYRIAVLERGFYHNNIRDSIWEYYYDDYPINSIKERGFYSNGMKNGLWESFYFTDEKKEVSGQVHYKSKKKIDTLLLNIAHTESSKRAKGIIRDNVKVGIWEYYYNGKLYLQFNHTTFEPVYDVIKIYSNIESDSIIKPHFIGDIKMLNYYLNKQISPRPNIDKLGYAVIEFAIDKFGSVNNFNLKENSSNKSFGKYVLDQVENLPHEWIPGFINGQATSMKYYITVYFDTAEGKESNIVGMGDVWYQIYFDIEN